MDLQCLFAIYYNEPNKIISSVKVFIEKFRTQYDKIIFIYSDFGTGGQLQQLCGKIGVAMICGRHCYSFYEGSTNFEVHG